MSRRLRHVVLAAGVAVLALALVVYAARRSIARHALIAWLEQRGVASAVQVTRFGPTAFVGRVRLGDPRAPDLSVERLEVRYRLRSGGVEVVSVRMVRPVLRMSLRGGRASFGGLDPIVREVLSRPPRPGAPQPKVLVEEGTVFVSTDYGRLKLTGQGRSEGGRVIALHAVSSPTVLKGNGFDADLGTGTLRLRGGPRAAVQLDLAVTTARAGATAIRSGWLHATLDAPYPQPGAPQTGGDVDLRATLDAQVMTSGDRRLSEAALEGRLKGRVEGGGEALTLRGGAVVQIAADAANLGAASARRPRARLRMDDLRWSRAGGVSFSTTVAGDAAIEGLTAGALSARKVDGRFEGALAWRPGPGFDLALNGGLRGDGAWTGAGGPAAGDAAQTRALKRALKDFHIDAPTLRLVAAEGRWALGAARPVRLTGAGGGVATVAGLDGAPLAGSVPGGFTFAIGGGGLPRGEVQVRRLTFGGQAQADLDIQLRDIALGPALGGAIAAKGLIRASGNEVSFVSVGCATLGAERLELGDKDVLRPRGRLCPAGGPLVTFARGVTRVSGLAEGVSADSELLQARVRDGAGRLEVGLGPRGAMGAVAKISSGRVVDMAPQPRFNPASLSGVAGFSQGAWTADLRLSDLQGRALGKAQVRHDATTGEGWAEIDTGELAFTAAGLQPARLSPLAAPIGSPAEGRARFAGRFDWTRAGLTSRGALDLPGLDFQSAAGRVTGLTGRVVFASLNPLRAEPGQTLQARRLEGPATFENLVAHLEIDSGMLRIAGGEAQVEGGRVRIADLEAPFDRALPVRGELEVEGVQLHGLVEASPFGDRVDLDAKVSGRIPFEVLGGRAHVANGSLRADGPGRLSIQREALTSVAAQGAPAAAGGASPPGADTFSNFAYQALENLAFSAMDMQIDSLPAGRLGVLFHISGRHDPPTRQRIRLSLAELISRRFLDRPLPLPSGTGVNLTLDTTLNLDQLLADFGEYQRLRGSRGVQP